MKKILRITVELDLIFLLFEGFLFPGNLSISLEFTRPICQLNHFDLLSIDSYCLQDELFCQQDYQGHFRLSQLKYLSFYLLTNFCSPFHLSYLIITA